MGDRYTLSLSCAKCGETNTDVWYAPSCGFDTFKCEHCGTMNDIVMGFVSKVHEGMTEADYDEFGPVLL
jgi:rRNA maturation protein Nop10